MSTIPDTSAGDEILATWGQAVADYINDNTSLTAATAGITNTETQVVGVTIPAGSLIVGTTYRLMVQATVTSSAANAVTHRVRIGPTTLTGNIVTSAAPTATTTASADGYGMTALVTVRSTGATGTITGNAHYVGGVTQPFANNAGHTSTTGTVVVDTTVDNILEFTIVTAAGTTTVTGRLAIIERLTP